LIVQLVHVSFWWCVVFSAMDTDMSTEGLSQIFQLPFRAD